MKLWLKGGIIGAGLLLLSLLLAWDSCNSLLVEGERRICGLNDIFTIPHSFLLNLLPFETAVPIMMQPAGIQIVIYTMVSFIIGSLMGWVVAKIKSWRRASK